LTRHAQIIRLRPEEEAEYVRRHKEVWPAVLRTIAECHIGNYSIFLRNGLLFAYFEYYGEDYEADMRKMAECPDTQRWWQITDRMQIRMEDGAEGETWSPLHEVFHFEGEPAPEEP
jgi:L-rhamnose mutarotase